MPLVIEIKDEHGHVTRAELTDSDMVIGRSSAADIRLNRPTVSRKHAQLSPHNGGWTLTDLDSTSGVSLNGQPIKQSEVKPGDTIQVSRFELRLIDPAAPAPSESFGLSTQWAPEQAPPRISALSFGPPPQIDFATITAINDFGRALREETDAATRLQRLCKMAAGQAMGANWALVLETREQDPDQTPGILAVSDHRLLTHQGLHISRTAVRAALKDQAPVLASNFGPDNESIDMSVIAGADAAAAVVCPLDEVQGMQRVLYVNLPPQRGSVSWLAVMALLAKEYQQAEAEQRTREAARERAAVERDMDNAREIQRSILPDKPEIDGLDIAWSFVPCDAVGGDLIDVMTLPDGRVLAAIADVSGHGLAAALATLSIHSILQTATKSGTAAEQMMTMLNDHLCAYLPPSRFVTMLVVLIDPETGETSCINAGHHAPLIVNASGQARELNDAGHLVLGVAPSEMTSAGDRLAPDETMLLYTDGLIEMQAPSGGLLQTEGLTGLFKDAIGPDAAAETITQSLRDALDTLQADHPVLDDQTFLVLRRPGDTPQ
ncbi:MAG: SpoIIE family protein phosphatase [Phycisphaeraceae bacterium]|nr:SpoIIE family protein phosphatase [Phycisphaeraceae bacterium]